MQRDGLMLQAAQRAWVLFDNQASKIAAKSFVLKDFICKSFRIKDYAWILSLTQ